MAMTVRRSRTTATPGPRPQGRIPLPAVVRRTVAGGAVIIDATARLQCLHQFIGYPGFLRCSRCEFRVLQLPLSKPGAIVLQFRAEDANR